MGDEKRIGNVIPIGEAHKIRSLKGNMIPQRSLVAGGMMFTAQEREALHQVFAAACQAGLVEKQEFIQLGGYTACAIWMYDGESKPPRFRVTKSRDVQMQTTYYRLDVRRGPNLKDYSGDIQNVDFDTFMESLISQMQQEQGATAPRMSPG